MTLDQILSSLKTSLSSAAEVDRLGVAARIVAEAFQTPPDDVAIFHFKAETDGLHFVWPPQLAHAGFIPITYKDCLAAQTARERKVFINNRFARSRHASIFECLRPKAKNGEAGLPIQKIMSVPLIANSELHGVIQVCRKGDSFETSGADFSRQQLQALIRLTPTLATLL